MSTRAASAQERLDRAERIVRNRTGRSASRIVERVAMAALLPHRANLGHLLIAVNDLARRVDWLKDFLIRRLGPSFESDLKVALHEEPACEEFSPAGSRDDNWAIVALHEAGTGSLADELSPLAALLLASLIDSSSDLPSPALFRIRDLSALILAIRRDPAKHPLRRLLHLPGKARSIAEAADQWDTAMRKSGRPRDVESAPEWNRFWVSWAQGVVKEFPAPRKAPRGIRPRPASNQRRERNPPTQFETGLQIGIDVDQPPSFQEPKEEHAKTFTCVARTPGKARTPIATDREERRLCFQSIHHLNQALHPNHISVISNAELEFLLEHYERLYSAARESNEWDGAAAIVVEELVLATGRPLLTIVSIPIVINDILQLSEGQDLVLCLESGELIQRPLRPAGGVTVSGLDDLVEDTSADLRLRLPPTLIAKIREVHSARPAAVVKGWFTPGRFQETSSASKGDVSAESLMSIRDQIALPDYTPAICGALSRLRHWLSCRINHASKENLSATMLLCGDDFGRSTAPLYYYSPTVGQLNRLYCRTVWPTFGDTPPADIPIDPRRTGSRLAVKRDVALQGIQELQRNLDSARRKYKRPTTEALARFHNCFVTYVLFHFCLITSHRPVGALFDVTADDFDLHNGLAMLSDKRVDPAHMFRLTCLSAGLQAQLRLLLDHLRALGDNALLPQETRVACSQAIQEQAGEATISGSGPIFFFLGPDGHLRQGIGTWREHWPSSWQRLESNWFRHFFATHLRECSPDLPAKLLFTQMGHLEAAGFPFSRSSPLSPVQFSENIAPALADFEKGLGFRHRDGLKSASSENESRSRSLRDWSDVLERAEKEIRQFGSDRARDFRALRAEHRKNGLDAGLRALKEVSPDLARLVESNPRAGGLSTDQEALLVEVSLDADQAEEVITKLEAQKLSPIMHLAARDQLSRKLRELKRVFKADVADTGRPYVLPPSEPTQFFKGALLARRDVGALRDRFLAEARELRKTNPHLFTLLNLNLLGGLSSESEIVAAGSKTTNAGRVSTDGGSFLLKGTDQQRTPTVGISGLGAVGICGPASDTPEVLDLGVASKELRGWWPQAFNSVRQGSELGVLLSTVNVSNRFEYSGLTNFSLSEFGAVGASFDLQRALLTKTCPELDTSSEPVVRPHILDTQFDDLGVLEPLAADQFGLECGATNQSPAGREIRDSAQVALRSAQRFLRKVFSTVRADRNGFVPGTNKMRAALDALIGTVVRPPELPSRIEWALGDFIRDMAFHGTAQRVEPAASTIHTYGTSFAKDLAIRLAGIDLRELDSEDFEEAFLSVVEGKVSPKAARRAAEVISRFADFLTKRYRLDPIPLSGLGEYLGRSDRSVHVGATTEAEYIAARQLLSGSITGSGGPAFSGLKDRRQLRMALLMLDLLYATGARISEIRFLRHADIFIHRSTVILFVRPTRHRKLKTISARRMIDVSAQLADDAKQDLREWVLAERVRLGGEFSQSALLFQNPDGDWDGRLTARLRNCIQEAFFRSSGRWHWPHLLRHLSINQAFISLATQPGPSRLTASDLAALKHRFGHSTILTSVSCYFHLPWIFRAGENLAKSHGISIQAISRLSCINSESLYKAVQRNDHLQTMVGDELAAASAEWALKKLSKELLAPPGRPGSTEKLPLVSSDRLALSELDLLVTTSKETGIDSIAGLGKVLGLSDGDLPILTSSIVATAPTSAGQRPYFTRLRVARAHAHPALAALPQRLDQCELKRRQLIDRVFTAGFKARAASRHNQLLGTESDLAWLMHELEDLGIRDLEVARRKLKFKKVQTHCLRFRTTSSGNSGFDRLCWILSLNGIYLAAIRQADVS